MALSVSFKLFVLFYLSYLARGSANEGPLNLRLDLNPPGPFLEGKNTQVGLTCVVERGDVLPIHHFVFDKDDGPNSNRPRAEPVPNCNQRIFPCYTDSIRQQNFTILLKSITRTDHGVYFCRAFTGNFTACGPPSTKTELIVYSVLPKVITVDSPFPVNENSHTNFTFDCIFKKESASGRQSVYWYWNKQLLIEGRSNNYCYDSACDLSFNRLLLQNVNRTVHGNYSCKVKNNAGLGPESPPMELIVNYPPGPATLISEPSEYGSALLRCSVQDAGEPKSHIFRWKRGNDIVRDETTANYFVTHVTSHSNDSFSCCAVNKIGAGEEATISIDVKKKEQSNEFSTMTLPNGAIVTGIFIVFLTLIATVLWFIGRIYKNKELQRQLQDLVEEMPMGSPSSEAPVSEQIEVLPYDKRWEFPKENLKFGTVLGSGAFGVVLMAEADGIVKKGTKTTVAVKRLLGLADTFDLRMMVSELKIMIHLGPHLNIINLLGACTKNLNNRELLVIVEYCKHGSLDKFLWKRRGHFKKCLVNATNRSVVLSQQGLHYADLSLHSKWSSCGSVGTRRLVDDPTPCDVSPTCSDTSQIAEDTLPCHVTSATDAFHANNDLYLDICIKDLLSWSFQVAKAMEYLADRKVVHGDLAARNILLHEDNIVKICDFGLSQNMYDKNYIRKTGGRFPIKWMAPESILGGKFSTESDVWTFGVTLWEIFTLAMTPYSEIETRKELLQNFYDGHRLCQPPYASTEMYTLMMKCWKIEPCERPTFAQIVDHIGELMEEGVRSHFLAMISAFQCTTRIKS